MKPSKRTGPSHGEKEDVFSRAGSETKKTRQSGRSTMRSDQKNVAEKG